MLHNRSLQFGFIKVSDVNAVFSMQKTITASNSVTVQYLSQLLTQVKHLIKSDMTNFSLNCLMYRDVPYCIICASYTSILECHYENKSLVSVKQQLD